MNYSEVIYGPPGTGKSTYLIGKMSEFVNSGIPANRIGLVSYTKAAAAELAQRAGIGAGGKISTMHSYAFKLSGIIRDQVIERAKLMQFSKLSGIETTGAGPYDNEQLGVGDYYLALYSLGRATLSNDWKDLYLNSEREGTMAEFLYFVKTYESFKSSYGYVDFSDMIDRAVGTDPDVDVLILDEAQDCTPAQWRLFRSWLDKVDKVYVAGDDDQTLYVWNGADSDGMTDFEREFNSVRVQLDQSYRVPRAVHRLAEGIIGNVTSRVDKVYKPRAHEGIINKYSDVRMLEFDPKQDTMILVRNHSLRDPIEEHLVQLGMPFVAQGGKPSPLDSRYGAAIKIWKKARENFDHTGQDMLTTTEIKILSRCAKPIYSNRVTDPAVLTKDWQQVLYMPPIYADYFRRLLLAFGTPTPATNIRICTIHASKGREADRVVLINGSSDRTAAAGDADAELRTFYVAVTRTRDILDIVTGDNPMRVLM